MSRLKQSIDSQHTKPWIERVGKLIINFSAIEFESLHWMVQLTEKADPKDLKIYVETPFAARVTTLMRHINERATTAAWRKKALRAWNEALKLAHVRNHVAHNPVVYGWRDPKEIGEPDFLKIPNLRNPEGRGGREFELPKSKADVSIAQMVTIAQTLQGLRQEWCQGRERGEAPPARAKPSLWYKVKHRTSRVVVAMRSRK